MTPGNDQSRCEWLAQLVEVGGAETAIAAAELAFSGVHRLLGCDRAALLRFDGDAIGVFATTVELDSDWPRRAGHELLETLRSGHVVRSPEPVGGPALLDELGLVAGAALPVQAHGAVWGALVVGQSSPHADDLAELAMTELDLSMLEALGSTLGLAIGRDEITHRLEESNRRLETYAHAAAHDLRSPLRRIRSFSQILRARLEVDRIDRVQVSDFADRIANGAERLDALLESMLEHASVITLAAESDEFVDLQAVAQYLCDGISELSHEPAPSFVITDLPEVRLPADVAERALRGLIESALTFSPPERAATIEITSRPSEGSGAVVVMEFPISDGRQI